jgi:TolA-binding protein
MSQWRWLLIFFALGLSGGQIFAAGPRENRDYTAAVSAFQDGIWDRAEAELAQFIQKYPKSSRVAEAVLMQAEAEFEQEKFTQAIALLKTRQAGAYDLADQYVYWIGQSQFSIADFPTAAETFSELARDFKSSTRRLDAVVDAAAARAKLGEWPQVGEVLQNPNGIFQESARALPADERIVRGQLLLAQALLAQNHPGAAAAGLQTLASQPLKPALDWQRTHLLYQIQLAQNDAGAALNSTTNLLRLANLEGRADLIAESVAEGAGVLERMDRTSEALAAYQQNLSTNMPVEWQRQAILKIAELAIAQSQFTNAEQSLENFIGQFPDAPAADVALLALGELHLKDYIAQPDAPDHLQEAQVWFDQFVSTFTNSEFLGKAYLDRGWCFWIAGKIPESRDSFEAAVEHLPQSEDLAVARFKLGDALYAQSDYTGALENYREVSDDFTNFPMVEQSLGAQALYQSLRASLKLNDVSSASNALARILKIYPTSNLADKSVLLVGEGLADLQQPQEARALFQKFEEKFPNSDQLPEVELAIARTYEQELDWPSAIRVYDQWVASSFATNTILLPQVEYTRAWANFQAGNETNAFSLFTNFITQFPTNALAPVAQWWVGDYFFNLGGINYVDAEKNYELVFQNWPASSLAYPAKMNAGRAAMARLGYSDAIRYFTSLTSDTNCPPDLYAQALFAYGGALMLKPSDDTNNPLANFKLAANVFDQICQTYPASEQAALAQGEIGDCYLQLAAQDTNAYNLATNAYAQVIGSINANVAARSQAQVGIGLVFEKRAALATGDDQKVLLQSALQNYLDVLYGKNLRASEQPDPFWTEKAGLQAGNMAEMLGEWPQAVNLYRRLEELLPPLHDLIEKKIARAREQLAAEKK